MPMGTQKKELRAKLNEMTHDDLIRWVRWIVGFAVVLLISVYSIYFLHFSSNGLSNAPEQWGQFGDFVGGTVNPILGFLTLIALVLTIIIQSRQLSVSTRELELSRRELELTREELSRSAQAQELSEKALRAQANASEQSARLTGINFLLDHYKAALSDMRNHSFKSNDPRLAHLRSLQNKEAVLLGMLDEVFKEMTKTKEKSGEVQDR